MRTLLTLLAITLISCSKEDQKNLNVYHQCATHLIDQPEEPEFLGSRTSTIEGVIKIPLVVHIVHLGEPVGQWSNISDAQIQSAIVALNEDFRKIEGTNGDGNGVDTEIEFCLASIDPSGNPTNGIVRVDGSVIPLYSTHGIDVLNPVDAAEEVDIKNLSRWPRNDYYNIWIVSEIEDNDFGAGIQGFAYYPGGSVDRDGAVIMFNAFGTVGTLKSYTALNRVTTHELGHAFYLYHSFLNSCTEENCLVEGDRVCDTPPSVWNPQCAEPECNGTQQVENYMDYTQQYCQNTFTQGQKDRMRWAIETFRPELAQSTTCSCPPDFNGDGVVDVDDFIQFNTAFGEDCNGCIEDLNGDGLVNVDDFLDFNSAFGDPCD